MAKKQIKRRLPKQDTASPTIVIIDKMSLVSIRLVESQSKLIIVGNEPPIEVEPSVNAGFGITETGLILGEVAVAVNTPASDERKSSVSIAAKFQCVYEVPNPPKERIDIPDAEQLAINKMSTMLVWPYARSHIQAVTCEMGIPTITLPLMRQDSLRSKREQK